MNIDEALAGFPEEFREEFTTGSLWLGQVAKMLKDENLDGAMEAIESLNDDDARIRLLFACLALSATL